MKKTAIAIALMSIAGSANAVLVNGSILNIGAGSFFTVGGATTTAAPGSDGQFLTGHHGLVLGTIQEASGSHSGVPDGSENPAIDNPWFWFGNTGMHSTESASNVLSASGNTATVDLSGWVMAWNGFDSNGGGFLIFGTGAWFGTTVDGVAQVICGVDCGDGDTYTLTYSATNPTCCHPTFGNVQYLLNLTGTISAVPVPSAIWLFGSGLMALAGAARFRKAV
jgi:hypothetical protein